MAVTLYDCNDETYYMTVNKIYIIILFTLYNANKIRHYNVKYFLQILEKSYK